MAHQLAALRFRSVGERSARFSDLTFDMTAPAQNGSIPHDSVIWLRNGGGKSSILSLLYAMLLPHANDFMGRVVQRSLTDYVDTGDTSHVVALWQPREAERDLLGDVEDRLITGVVHEWENLHRPTNASESRSRLSTSFYAFHCTPGLSNLGDLPFLDPSGQPYRLKDFLEALRGSVGPHARLANLAVTDKQNVWANVLSERHLDPEIFRTQKLMNHVEGGVEDLFKFPAAKDFIDFLLDLTTNPQAPASVADRLSTITSLIAAKPAKLDEQRFCDTSASCLDQVAERYTELRTAREQLATATDTARTLASSLQSAVHAASAGEEQLGREKQELGIARTSANSEKSAANDLNYLYRREAARLRLREAEAERDRAQGAATNAQKTVRAWEVSQQLATLARLEGELAQAELAASAEEEETAPLREATAAGAEALRSRLAALSREAEDAATEADSAHAAATDQAEQEGLLEASARSDLSAATTDASKAATRLEELARRRGEGVTLGHLPSESVDPGSHHEVVTRKQADREQDVVDLDRRVKDRHRRRTEINGRQTSLAVSHASTEKDRALAADRSAKLRGRHQALLSSPRLQDLAEASDEQTIDLWSEADLLIRRLSDAVLAADNERILLRAEQQADQRTISVQENTGLLPSTLDADLVQRVLTDAGIAAQTGWAHLTEIVTADRLVALLDASSVARLGCGIVVPSASLADAVRELDSRSVMTTSLVGLYSAEAADAIIRGETPAESTITSAAWSTLQPGLVDPARAESVVESLRERARSYNSRDQELLTLRSNDKELADQVQSFIEDCPDGHLDALNAEIDRLDQALEAIEVEQEALTTEIQQLDGADLLDEGKRANLNTEIQELKVAAAWLASLAEAFAHQPELLAQLRDAEAREQDADQRARRHAESQRKALIEANRYSTEMERHSANAAAHRAEHDGLPTRSEDLREVEDDTTIPLDVLRQRYHDAKQALQLRASQSVLADRVQQLTDRVLETRQETSRCTPDERTAATLLLASAEGQDPMRRSEALEAAKHNHQEAVSASGAANGSVREREKEVAEIERLHRNPPRRTLPIIPGTSGEADLLAAEQETAGQTAQARATEAEELIAKLELQISRSSIQREAFSTLLETLPEPADAPDVDPFDEDVEAARARSRDARSAITNATKKVDAADTELIAAVDSLRRTASRHPGITGPVKDRVTNDPADLLAPNAADLATRLRLRSQTLGGELTSIAEDQRILNEALAHLVRESMDTLGKAERSSVMKTMTGSWSGKKILRITFDRPSDSDLLAYAERVIDRRVREGLKPEGMSLLKAAVHEAAGPRGFSVKVLKPTDDSSGTTEDISRLAKWSGGEKLTVCVALYCTLAALRAAHIGRRGRMGGVLLLDNPIGRASAAGLVRLQRDVAATHGIQLIYTTGVKDPAAVIQFPNVIRLDNREGRAGGRRYIVHDEAGSDVGYVTGIRSAHNDHRWGSGDSTGHQDA